MPRAPLPTRPKATPENARKEQAMFLEKAKLVPKEETFGNNTAEAILALAARNGRRRNPGRAKDKLDAGIAELRDAIKLEDALNYDEPPGWLIPVRHSLGAILMQSGRYAEAEQVYREDLARLPENGWSLYGLAESLRAQKKNDDGSGGDAKRKFKKMWAKADTEDHQLLSLPARK